ncbi:uncharacterized protein C8R40DRAFT_1175477 [Lentinula edodes]|uniref:uncharacterized protein n=1 Tax=Lentinula edodes TaxID=5353 RepID=UPI001E8E5CCA|nr:uncharacterized protein C8R40DRAFT_1175477 [Lentinula edodes]KAH7870457.1 hypothetical protein C8R40DRAFT_1175477 [Lentinula edodes]
MSARLYTPGSFTSSRFEFRQRPGQIYDELTRLFKDMGPTAIANAEYGIDFFREKYGNEWSTHFCYVDGESQEFTGNLFGEVLGDIHGTAVGAQGNHFVGNDRSSLAVVKEIVKEVVSEHPLDAITLTGPLLYTAPQAERRSGTKGGIDTNNIASKLKKRKLTQSSDGEKEPDDPHKSLGFPPDASITVGAQYDYKLMPDYGGKVFALNKARLLQPDWRKIDGDLIVPWKNYLQLRPGTVVVANVSFRLHVLQPKDKRQVKRKVYQAVINFLKVVAESDLPVESPVPPSAHSPHAERDILPADDCAISVLRSIGSTRIPPSDGKVLAVGENGDTSKETPVPAKRLRLANASSSRPSLDTYVGQVDRLEHAPDLSILEDMHLNNVDYNELMEEFDVDM